eukprot:TRINITY_DN963_c0_g1_i1.p1 TRINITY_DN963_c0_g1~~TRINITY_DN963_c0_g1_i1.p1  ORF type:complete len:720 (+),score=170.19 TRINITY_DN963_c0_g1_i1:96-2255(+)
MDAFRPRVMLQIPDDDDVRIKVKARMFEGGAMGGGGGLSTPERAGRGSPGAPLSPASKEMRTKMREWAAADGVGRSPLSGASLDLSLKDDIGLMSPYTLLARRRLGAAMDLAAESMVDALVAQTVTSFILPEPTGTAGEATSGAGTSGRAAEKVGGSGNFLLEFLMLHLPQETSEQAGGSLVEQQRSVDEEREALRRRKDPPARSRDTGGPSAVEQEEERSEADWQSVALSSPLRKANVQSPLPETGHAKRAGPDEEIMTEGGEFYFNSGQQQEARAPLEAYFGGRVTSQKDDSTSFTGVPLGRGGVDERGESLMEEKGYWEEIDTGLSKVQDKEISMTMDTNVLGHSAALPDNTVITVPGENFAAGDLDGEHINMATPGTVIEDLGPMSADRREEEEAEGEGQALGLGASSQHHVPSSLHADSSVVFSDNVAPTGIEIDLERVDTLLQQPFAQELTDEALYGKSCQKSHDSAAPAPKFVPLQGVDGVADASRNPDEPRLSEGPRPSEESPQASPLAVLESGNSPGKTQPSAPAPGLVPSSSPSAALLAGSIYARSLSPPPGGASSSVPTTASPHLSTNAKPDAAAVHSSSSSPNAIITPSPASPASPVGPQVVSRPSIVKVAASPRVSAELNRTNGEQKQQQVQNSPATAAASSSTAAWSSSSANRSIRAALPALLNQQDGKNTKDVSAAAAAAAAVAAGRKHGFNGWNCFFHPQVED